MKITQTQWQQTLELEEEFKKRDAILTRKLLSDSLHISEQLARQILFALENKSIIRLEPVRYENSHNENIVIFSDSHFPYQDDTALNAILKFISENTINSIIINGDLIDFYQLSRFKKNPKKKSVQQEINDVKNFLCELRKNNPNVLIKYKEGNHESHLQRFILNNAKEIYELIEDLYIQKLDLQTLDIEYIIKPFCYRNLWVFHGHEKQGVYSPANICRAWFPFILDHFVVGHYHKGQEEIFHNFKNENFKGIAIGHTADSTGLDYAIVNNWNQGFLFVKFNSKGFISERKTIVNGEIF